MYKNIKYIIYKVGKKYYKIKTFGFVIILGDLGTSIVKINKNKMIVGQIWDIKKNYKLLDRFTTDEFSNIEFMDWNSKLLTFDEFRNTVAFNILTIEPYSSQPIQPWHLKGIDVEYLNKLKSTTELLEYFDDKYGISKEELDNCNMDECIII